MTSIEKAAKQVAARQQQDAADLQDVVETNIEPLARESDAIVSMADAQLKPHTRVAKFDLEQARAFGMLMPDDPDSSIAEQFRRIKRPLLNNAFGLSSTLVEKGNLIMVTSAVPSEGKTFVSVSLAVSIAMELDKTVLLVDADVVKESATKLFTDTETPGLLDVIVNPEVQIEDVITPTDIPKLSLLPAGRPRGRATELLASGSMRQITEELASRYDDRMIVFDSPPLLATSEASVLASLMGQIIMVVEAEKTTQKRVADAMAMLDPNKPIGMLLNKSRTAEHGGYYYGYYG